MRTRLLSMLAMLAVLVLLLAACNDGNDVDDAAEPPEQQLEQDTPEVDLGDDVAADVNGESVPRAAVEDRVDDAIDADDELAAQVEGDEGEQLLDMFRAQTLTVMVQTRIILQGAAAMGIEPTDDDIAEAREELVAEFGGQEELDDAVEQAGISEAALDDQLEGIAALNAVGDALVEEGEMPEVPEEAEGMEELDPADLAVQQWLGEQVAAADVAVHPDYGQWDPQSGQVMPAGGPVMPQMPEEEALPEEEPLPEE